MFGRLSPPGGQWGAAPLWGGAVAALVAACTWLALGARPGMGALGAAFFFTLRAIEALIAVYVIAFVVATVRYLRRWRRPPRADDPEPAQWPRAAVLYLCCGDIDETALRSLSRLQYPGQLLLLLHDDSTASEARAHVDAVVRRIGREEGVAWRVLRRPARAGGKPGAVQWTLERTAGEHDIFLLADNDSTAPDPHVLRRAAPTLMRDNIACVQMRNRRRPAQDEGRFGRWASASIDIFDAFTTGMFEPLWKPFVGHNAVLRTDAVMAAGGFTPGMFADDLDLTVRLNIRGWRVEHRRDLVMQETHPTNYRSFCMRSQKWATGCGQALRVHARRVLTSDAMTRREKFGFFLFTGFFVAQAATLLYATIIFILLPPLTGAQWAASDWALAVGTIAPLTVFLPVLAYLGTEGARLPLLATLGSCAGTYGSTDLWTVRGLRQGLAPRREARWTPTNSVRDAGRPLLDWGHFAFGALFLIVPLLWQPALLAFPLTWLFAAKYLFVPAVAAHYTERIPEPAPAPAVAPAPARVGAAAGAVLLAAALLFPSGARAQPDAPEAGDLRALFDGEPIRGVHFTPWRPGTGPGRGLDYPADDLLREDLRLISEMHAGAVVAYDPPQRMLALAGEFDLRVLYVFNIQWWRLADSEEERRAAQDEIVARVADLRDQPAVFAWMLGNEAPGWVIDSLGAGGLRDFLSETRRRIREEAGDKRPVCHGNWPLNRTLDLDRDMDILCYNIYPFYPTEVAVMGFGPFIEQEIMPLADGRPVLITEFGANTIEASEERQAQILVESWRGLLDAGADGGFVFSFADEWWKNYDNPIAPPDYWRREEAPDDHLTDDEDPEEHYGVVDARRRPKPAYHAVGAMFAMTRDDAPAEPTPAEGGAAALSLTSALRWGAPTMMIALVLAAAVWLRARARRIDASGEL